MNKKLLLAAAMLLGFSTATVAEELQFGYCSDVVENHAGGVQPGSYIGAAIEIPAETATHWAGNQIKAVNLGFGQSKARQVTIFLTDDLTATPFYEQSVVVEHQDRWTLFNLDTPYEFTGETVYVGYYLRVASGEDYPIGIDDDVESASPYGDYIGLGTGKKSMRENWKHYGERYGNIALRIVLEGDNWPACDATALNLSAPVVIKPNTPFDITGRIYNRGTEPINDFDMSVAIGDEDAQTVHVSLDAPVESGVSGEFRATGLVYGQEGVDIPVVISVKSVNGNDNASANTFTTLSLSSSESMWPRVIVAEEGTYLDCPNCPRGIVGLREMTAKYPDTFIGLGVHTSSDMFYNMYVAGYQPIINMFQQVPISLINREIMADPGFSTLEGVYQKLEQPIFAKVDVDAKFADEEHKKITFSATTTYGMDMPKADYRLSFVITENQVGPYPQKNNYHDNMLGPMGGFESMPFDAYILLDHVVRYTSGVYGLEESSMTNVTKGQVCNFEYTIDVPTNISNIENIDVVALLIDNSNAARQIYTADKKDAEHTLFSGVESVSVDNSDAPVEYYNLQGVRVENPAAGNVYIRRQGTAVTKILVK